MDVHVRHLILTFACFAPLWGCQTPDPSIELLESELRWMEDQLYALDQQLDQTSAQLASCQRNNSSLRHELSEMRRQGAGTAGSGSRRRSAAGTSRPGSVGGQGDSGLVPPAETVPRADDYDPEDLSVPEIDYGPALERGASPEAMPPAPGNLPFDEPPGVDTTFDSEDNQAAVDVQVSRIVLNSRLTGGYDFDGQPGDEGLLVVIEPQNAAGQYVPLPGDLTIDVRDPQASGVQQRIARWEFDASETVPYIRTTLLGKGIHLKLPWPNVPPDQDRLLVEVRYRAPTGKQLAARREFRVDLQAEPQSQVVSAARRTGTDQLVPQYAPPRDQLLSDRTLAPPAAPLGLDDQAIPFAPAPSSLPQVTPSRIARGAAGGTVDGSLPQWRPYR